MIGFQTASAPTLRLRPRSFMLVMSAALLGAPASAEDASSTQPLSGLEVAQKVADRDDGEGRVRTIEMTLTNARGQSRTRVARSFHRSFDDAVRIAIYFTAPAALADTAFASVDRPQDSDASDEQWLYLPATERVRAIPASDRGDAFMGTDFSYDDIKSNLKLSLDDHTFDLVETRQTSDGARHVLRAAPIDAATAEELGYAAATAVIDPATWMIDAIDYEDDEGVISKSVVIEDVQQVQGVWTAMQVRATSHASGHETVFKMSDVTYVDGLDARVFDRNELEFGAPDVN